MKRFSMIPFVLVSFAFAACGGGDKPVEEPQPAPVAEEAPPPAETPAETPPPTADTTPPPPPAPPPPAPKTLSEDLDGDGTPEEVSLAPSGELKVGEAQVGLAADKLGDFASVELKTLDLDKKDKSKEIAVASGSTWWVVTYDGKKKTLGEPAEVTIPSGAEPTMKGDKKLVTVVEDCGQKATTTWSLSKGKLSKKEKKSGKRDEKKCAGGEAPAPAEGDGG